MPAGDICGDGHGLLMDVTVRQAPQLAGEGPDRKERKGGQAGQGDPPWNHRMNRSSKKTSGRECIVERQRIGWGGMEKPGCFWKRGKMPRVAAKTDRHAERIVPESKPPCAGQVGSGNPGA